MTRFRFIYQIAFIAIFGLISTKSHATKWVLGIDEPGSNIARAHLVTDVNSVINVRNISANDGNHVGIAIIEKGFDPKVCDGNIKLAAPGQLQVIIGEDHDMTDMDIWHGNHIASTILQIAPGSKIYPYVWGNEIDKSLSSAIYAAADNDQIAIINLSIMYSLGYEHSEFDECFEPLKYAVSKGKLIVQSLGNNGLDSGLKRVNANDMISTLMEMSQLPDINGQMVLVANSCYDSASEKLNPESGRPLGECEFALTGPGTGIIANITDDTLGIMSGTSMSTPIVSGVLARLISDFPAIKKSDILNAVLKSARTTSYYDSKKPLSDPKKPSRAFDFGKGVVDYESANKYLIAMSSAAGAAAVPSSAAAPKESLARAQHPQINPIARFPQQMPIVVNTFKISLCGVANSDLDILWPHLPRGVKILNLSKMLDGDAGMKVIMQGIAASPLPDLESLLLENNQIGNPGIITLLQTIKNPRFAKLSNLMLGGNIFDQEGIDALKLAGFEEDAQKAGKWDRLVKPVLAEAPSASAP